MSTKRLLPVTFAVVLVYAVCSVALALPVYKTSQEGVAFTVRDTGISIEVVNNLVQTTIEQTIVNPSDKDCPCSITIAVPKDSRISSFSAYVNGKHYKSVLMRSAEAKEVFDEAEEAVQDAALASESGEGLQIQLTPVKAGSTFTFRFCFIKQADYADGFFEFGMNVTDKQDPIWSTVHSTLEMDCTVPVLSVESKTHSLTGSVTGKKARFEFSGAPKNSGEIALRWQLELLPGKPAILLRDAESEDPFFGLICLPPDLATFDDPRSVVILLDKSGSMGGDSYKMACESALKFIDRLRDQDIFNLVMYDTANYYAAPFPFKADKRGKEAAAAFLGTFTASGGTRFLQPVIDTLKMLQLAPKFRPSVLLVSDGQDNVDRAKAFYDRITAEVGFDIPIYTFAIGNGVDMPLMRCLSESSGASVSSIQTAAQITTALETMARRFENTVVANFAVSFPKDTVYDGFPRKQVRLYKGEPFVMSGRTRDEIRFKMALSGITSAGNWDSPVDISTVSETNDCAFLPKIWAALKMRELLDRIEIFGETKELVEEVIALSLRYSISSPYTSFVVVCTEDGSFFDQSLGVGSPTGAYGSRMGGKRYGGGAAIAPFFDDKSNICGRDGVPLPDQAAARAFVLCFGEPDNTDKRVPDCAEIVLDAWNKGERPADPMIFAATIWGLWKNRMLQNPGEIPAQMVKELGLLDPSDALNKGNDEYVAMAAFFVREASVNAGALPREFLDKVAAIFKARARLDFAVNPIGCGYDDAIRWAEWYPLACWIADAYGIALPEEKLRQALLEISFNPSVRERLAAPDMFYFYVMARTTAERAPALNPKLGIILAREDRAEGPNKPLILQVLLSRTYEIYHYLTLQPVK